MIEINRRRLLQGSTALGAGALLGGTSLLDWAKAWAEEMPFKPEKDAKLRALRWNRFVETEDIQFDKNIVAFTEATGIEVRLDKEFMDDIQPTPRSPPTSAPARTSCGGRTPPRNCSPTSCST